MKKVKPVLAWALKSKRGTIYIFPMGLTKEYVKAFAKDREKVVRVEIREVEK